MCSLRARVSWDLYSTSAFGGGIKVSWRRRWLGLNRRTIRKLMSGLRSDRLELQIQCKNSVYRREFNGIHIVEDPPSRTRFSYLSTHFILATSTHSPPIYCTSRSFLILIIPTSKPTKRLGPLRLGPLQTPHIQAQCGQNSRRNLLRANSLLVLRLLEIWVAQDTSNMPIIVVQTTVLGNLFCTGGVDDAVLGRNDDIWDCWIGGWVPKTLGCELSARDDVVDFQRGAVGIEVVDCDSSIFLVLKPDESNIVGSLLVNFYLCCIHDEIGIYLFVQGWVDG